MPWKKQFDPQVALRKAVEIFWTLGYEGTSMTDLLQAMGIQKGSFYDTFGSKHQVYMQAIDQYCKDRFESFDRQTTGKSPKEAILALMDLVRRECSGELRSKSCLVVNSVLERAHADAEAKQKSQEVFKFHEKVFSTLIREGQQQGSISKSVHPANTAKVLLGLTMAMRVYGKSGAPKSTINVLFDQCRAVLEGTEAAS